MEILGKLKDERRKAALKTNHMNSLSHCFTIDLSISVSMMGLNVRCKQFLSDQSLIEGSDTLVIIRGNDG